jgi:hypothetical protein
MLLVLLGETGARRLRAPGSAGGPAGFNPGSSGTVNNPAPEGLRADRGGAEDSSVESAESQRSLRSILQAIVAGSHRLACYK